MKRVILHWTAGTNNVSVTDRKHYHRIVDGEGSIFAGAWPIEANEVIKPGSFAYAAHTLNCNTGAIGVALAGMRGATESPFSAGLSPINELQMRAAAQVVADLCVQYSIPVTPTTVLTHAEVEPTLGIKQNKKWDISRLPWRPDIVGARPVGDHIRALVLREMKAAPTPAPATIPPKAPSPPSTPPRAPLAPQSAIGALIAGLVALFSRKRG